VPNGDNSTCTDCAGVPNGSTVNCPGWTVNANLFEFTSTIIAASVTGEDGSLLGDAGDELAAFDASGDIRGVGVQITPTFGSFDGQTLYEVQLYSNASGDVISFQYYDVSADEVFDIGESYVFAPSETIGSLVVPFDLNIQTSILQSINVVGGWNWFSLNVVPDPVLYPDMTSLLASLGDGALFVGSQSDGTVTNYPQYGQWSGTLTSLEPGKKYRLKMDVSATFDVLGSAVDVASTQISLSAGWNWLGYVPQNPGDVESAFASLGADALFIGSQAEGTSTNYPQYGQWAGTLTTLEPGAGYMLKMANNGTLTYPDFGLARVAENKQPVELTPATKEWAFDHAEYEHGGTITASIESREDFDGDLIGVFVDGECRGLGERMHFSLDDSHVYIIQTYSNMVEGEELHFKYLDSASDEVIEFEETLTFENNMIVGNGFNTFALSREVGDSVQPNVFGIGDAYPNPFNPVTSFNYSVPTDGMVHVSVHDINGRLVAELVNGHVLAGTHPVTWDAGNLSSGLYLIKMLANEEHVAMQKIMLIK
jgi:hypothetical protein